MDFEREGKKKKIFLAMNSRFMSPLKAFCEKEKKIAASEILEFIELVMMEVTKSEMKNLVIMEKKSASESSRVILLSKDKHRIRDEKFMN